MFGVVGRVKLPEVKRREVGSKGAGWLLGCLAWFLAFAIGYAFTNPPGEAPDENGHLAFANYVARHGQLPVQTDPSRAADQGHHFPLYYVLGAGLIRLTDEDGFVDAGFEPNPAFVAYGGSRGDVPRFLHDGAPGDLASVRLLRLLSVFFGAVTVLFVGLAARQALSEGPWWLAPAFVASLPQFQFVSASVSNDSVMAATAALTLWALIRALQKPELRRWIAVGLALGLAIWAKKSSLVLVPVVVLAALTGPAPNGYWKSVGVRWAAALVPVLLIAGPLFVRQHFVYGDMLGNAMERATLPHLVDEKSILDPYFVTSFPKVTMRSFVAHFGWMNVAAPTITILGHWVVSVLLGLLALTGLFDPDRRRLTVILLGTILLAVAGLVFYNLTYTQAQGRLLFPALAAFAILLACGADRLKTPTQVLWVVFGVWVPVDMVAFSSNLRFYGG